MFTGIINNVGIITSLIKDGDYFIEIKAGLEFAEQKAGNSICCNGICLTITKIDHSADADNVILSFQLSNHTIELTTAQNWQVGQLINLESSLQYQGEVHGHFVSGHIDGYGEVTEFSEINQCHILKVRIADEYNKFIMKKGSITLDGISLTINDSTDNIITINIIQHTYNHTNLRDLQAGDLVNFEVDLMARQMYHFFSNK